MIQARNINFETTTTTDGWKKTVLSSKVTIYRKTYTLSGHISGTAYGDVACTVYPPSEFSTADDINIIGESARDSVAEIYYRRLDSLQRSGGARIYGVSLKDPRTMNGVYTITLLKTS